MQSSFSFWLLAELAGLFAALLLVAFTVWLFGPRILARYFPLGSRARNKKVEDQYRRALTEIPRFPFAVVGSAAVMLSGLQAVDTYIKSQQIAHKAEYESGFTDLASTEQLKRIKGLYSLQLLLNSPDSFFEYNPSEVKSAILTAISVFLSRNFGKNSGVGDKLTPEELIALQVIAYRASPNHINFVADLSKGNFSNVRLSNSYQDKFANFMGFDFHEANFSGSDLYRADLTQTNVNFANFNGANLAGVVLTNSGLSHSKFCPERNLTVGELFRSYPVRAQLEGAQLNNVYAEGSNFSYAWMIGARFNDAKLKDAVFYSAELNVATFENAMLDKPDFRMSNIQGVNFSGASLEGARFGEAFIKDVDFRSAKAMNDGDLAGAYLCNVTKRSGEKVSSGCMMEDRRKAVKDVAGLKADCP